MTSTLQPANPIEAVKRPGRWLALSVLVLAVLLVAVDATVLGLATPYISEDLKPSGTQLLWIGDVYSFVIAGLLVSMGSLGDRIGRKRILLVGATAFGAISVLNAYATTPEFMIFARALLGVAGATLMPATLALIRNIFHDPRERSLAVVSGGLAAVGLALAALTVIDQSTGYPLLGTALLFVGIGAGFSFTVTADVILGSVPKEQAGAASAVSETAYELGAALGIAVLGSIVTGVYRDFTGPAGTSAQAHESLGGAVEASAGLPARTSEALLDAARASFVDGLALAAGAGAAVLLTAAVAAWFLLRGQRLDSAA
ncbi:MFS transporter [Streptomyces sp. NPDC006602]|uniref:MFS transporter n=1 Tax=Streptomyces sp. NPDC006602 TaxID=3364751 RepID=UPI0036C02811